MRGRQGSREGRRKVRREGEMGRGEGVRGGREREMGRGEGMEGGR